MKSTRTLSGVRANNRIHNSTSNMDAHQNMNTKEKEKFSVFSTCDLDLSCIPKDVVGRFTNVLIFINESLHNLCTKT